MPDRSSPVTYCPHALECPGCPLLGRPYDEQLGEKRRRVERAVTAFRLLSAVPIADTLPADPIVGYRTRSKLAVEHGAIGLFERGTHHVVDAPDCRVLHPSLLAVANGVRAALPLGIPLRALDLQLVDEGVLVTLVVAAGADRDAVEDAVARLSRSVPGLAGVSVGERDEASHQLLGRAPTARVGASYGHVTVLPGGPHHLAAPGGFAQAHRGQQRVLFERVLEALARRPGGIRGAKVLELYAGAGALSLLLAQRGAEVVAAEAYEPAVRLCREAAATQGLGAVRAEAADAAAVARAMALAGRRFDAIVVNPPRRGLPPALRADLAHLAPPMVFYVSCEPTTLARDLSDLALHGLRATSLQPVDMMPLTEEVETLAMLAPADPPVPEVLHADDRLIAVVKPPHEPTIPQGEHRSSLLARVRTLPDAAQAVPVHRLDLGTSGVCLFARTPAFAHELSVALAEGEKEYVALVRGVSRDKGSVRRALMEQGQAREARTRYTRREVAGGHSLVTVRPDEGRKHQIRRHLSSIGHPVVGDDRYGDPRTNQFFQLRHFLDRTFLHCARIALTVHGRKVELEAPLWPDLSLVLDALRAAGDPRPDPSREAD